MSLVDELNAAKASAGGSPGAELSAEFNVVWNDFKLGSAGAADLTNDVMNPGTNSDLSALMFTAQTAQSQGLDPSQTTQLLADAEQANDDAGAGGIAGAAAEELPSSLIDTANDLVVDPVTKGVKKTAAAAFDWGKWILIGGAVVAGVALLALWSPGARAVAKVA